jgi:hypothetical protein
MEVTLAMFKANGDRRDFALPKARSVIGRISTCDLRIPLSGVSRNHCEVYAERGTLKVRDLNSSNGTFLNSTRISREMALNPGDRIQIGPVTFTLVVDGVPAKLEPSDSMLAADAAVAAVAAVSRTEADAKRKRDAAKRDKVESLSERSDATVTKDRGAGLDGLLAVGESDLRKQGRDDGQAAKKAPRMLEVKPEKTTAAVDKKKKKNSSDQLDLDDPIAALGAMASNDSDSNMSWMGEDDDPGTS